MENIIKINHKKNAANAGMAKHCPVYKKACIQVAKKEVQKKRKVENTKVRKFTNISPGKTLLSSNKKS